MREIKNYRPHGLEVTLDDSVVKLMIIRIHPKFGIIAKVKGGGRFVLWEPNDVAAHADDTEEQFIKQLKLVI